MKIRSKLLTLILIPLLVTSAAGYWVFRTEAVKSDRAGSALGRAELSSAIHSVVIGYGNERLALYSEPDVDEVRRLRAATDQALADADLPTDVVEAARAEDDRSAAADLYSAAIESLLSSAAVNDAYEADQVLTAVAVHTAFEMLEARESAWFTYIDAVEAAQADNAAPTPLVPISIALNEATTLADETEEFVTGQSAPQLGDAVRSEAERTLDNLAFLAVNELADGEIGITPDEILAGLVNARAEWNGALLAADEFVEADMAQTFDEANTTRWSFALLAVGGLSILVGLVYLFYRSITHPLELLVERARIVAGRELPEIVRRLRSEDGVEDLPDPKLIPVTNNDEIGQLVDAFNDLQVTAHELASEQALARRNVGELFVNLGRRNQQLLHRILSLLTDLERDEEDPDTLRDLFVLDNVVTRMRRNAESLVVLAGGQTPRQWTDPVPLEDTVRSALSEVEGYQRVDIAALAEVRLPGGMVADVAHLLAELIENALSFSDPAHEVLVGGHFEDDGYLITIFDQGIGMTDAELESNNRRISDPPTLDKAPAKFLGLFVVGRLADRHDITVRLQKAPGRGVMARVMIPKAALIVDEKIEPAVPIETVAPIEVTADLIDETVGAGVIDEAFADAGDLDDVLAEVGTDEIPVVSPDPDGPVILPVRRRGASFDPGAIPLGDEQRDRRDDDQRDDRHDDDRPGEQSREPLATESPELPTRIRGYALSDAGGVPDSGSAASPTQPEQRESVGEEAAGSFASMMSAFSSGVSRGLDDSALDGLDDGNDQ